MPHDDITQLIREWQKGSSDAESALFEALWCGPTDQTHINEVEAGLNAMLEKFVHRFE